MKIVALRTKTDSGEVQVNELNLIENLGIEGDKKASGGDRQLTLCDSASFSEYRNEASGLCVKRFMSNILTNGLDYSTLKEGDTFQIGNSIIEISSTVKKCFPECEFVKAGKTCQIKHSCAFARILKSGTIHKGDEIIES